MGISLCMIVRNEEDWVEGAVQSVRSIVNEVIIVDTGPTDATLELDAAQKFLEAALGQNRTLTEKESGARSEEHTSELQSPMYLVCRLLLEKKKKQKHK